MTYDLAKARSLGVAALSAIVVGGALFLIVTRADVMVLELTPAHFEVLWCF